ncbi:uncharacterized protein K02A2.6-like [Tigriopus californicus]|uniref:uncharacterized protein K02A2.6-like n=1 Tax=Tigriopus californicus TaxID=6832 RepID=UPI0027DA7146|nr:uncharacterized protein K02A2.6-like [Tigriopus californicus]
MFYNILAVTINRERTKAPPALSAILEVGEAQLQAIVDTGAQEVPPRPWHLVSLDLFGPTPRSSHVVVARCNSSRYTVVVIIPKLSAAGLTIGALRAMFQKLGFPRTIRTDNGAIFHSSDFRQFADQHGIAHTFPPPYHPRSNPAECAMKLIGKAIKMSDQTATGMERALSQALEDYQRPPHPATGHTPRDLMRKQNNHSVLGEAARKDRQAKLRRASTWRHPRKDMSLHQGQHIRHGSHPNQTTRRHIPDCLPRDGGTHDQTSGPHKARPSPTDRTGDKGKGPKHRHYHGGTCPRPRGRQQPI